MQYPFNQNKSSSQMRTIIQNLEVPNRLSCQQYQQQETSLDNYRNISHQQPNLRGRLQNNTNYRPKVAVVQLYNLKENEKENKENLVHQIPPAMAHVSSTKYLKTEGSIPNDQNENTFFQPLNNNIKRGFRQQQQNFSINGNQDDYAITESQKYLVQTPQVSLNFPLSRSNSVTRQNSTIISHKTQYISQPKQLFYMAPRAQFNLNLATGNQFQRSHSINLNNTQCASNNSSLNNSIYLNNSNIINNNQPPQKTVYVNSQNEIATPTNKFVQSIQLPIQKQIQSISSQGNLVQPRLSLKQISIQNAKPLQQIVINKQADIIRQQSPAESKNLVINNIIEQTGNTFFTHQLNQNQVFQNKHSQIIPNYSEQNILQPQKMNDKPLQETQNNNICKKCQHQIEVDRDEQSDSFKKNLLSFQQQEQGGITNSMTNALKINMSQQYNNFSLKKEEDIIKRKQKEALSEVVNQSEQQNKSIIPPTKAVERKEEIFKTRDESQTSEIEEQKLQKQINKQNVSQIQIQNEDVKKQCNENEIVLVKKIQNNEKEVQLNFTDQIFSFAGDSFSNYVDNSKSFKLPVFSNSVFLSKEELINLISQELNFKYEEKEIVNQYPKRWLLRYQNSSKYEGSINEKSMTREGKGRFVFRNGYQYDGEWIDDKLNGLGTITSASGRVIYEGQFVNNKFEGKGIFYNLIYDSSSKINFRNLCSQTSSMIRYEGQFKSNQKQGFGLMYFSSGERYVGFFENDMVTGSGTFFTGQDKFNGEWKEGILIRYKN